MIEEPCTQRGVAGFVKAKPDGYTTLANLLPTTNLIFLDSDRAATFSRKGFTPIAIANVDPSGFNVKTSSPNKTMKDLVDAAKGNLEG